MKIYRISVLAFVLIAFSLIAWGLKLSHAPARKKHAAHTIKMKPVIQYDPALLAEYEKLYKKFNTIPPDYTMSGSINVNNPADSSENMSNVPYFFCKQGDQFYYQLGLTETLNANGKYVFVDNGAGDIIVSDQKRVQYDQSPISFAEMGKKLLAENFTMSATVNGEFKTISFSSEHHASCKRFSVTYDPVSYEIRGISARLTNIQAPLDSSKDKIVYIIISEWKPIADLTHYKKLNKYFAQTSGELKGTGKYKNYKIILQ